MVINFQAPIIVPLHDQDIAKWC